MINFTSEIIEKYFKFLIISIFTFNGYFYLMNLANIFNLNPLYSTNYLHMSFSHILFIVSTQTIMLIFICLTPIVFPIVTYYAYYWSIGRELKKFPIVRILQNKILQLLKVAYNHFTSKNSFWLSLFVISLIMILYYLRNKGLSHIITNELIQNSLHTDQGIFVLLRISLETYIKTVIISAFILSDMYILCKITHIKPTFRTKILEIFN
jgi:hypothetical protein